MPPTTRARAKRAAPAAAPPPEPPAAEFEFLRDLPDELLREEIARKLLDADLPAALCLCASSKALRGRLAEVREKAEARRLRWVEELTKAHIISDEGRTLTGYAWAAGGLLPPCLATVEFFALAAKRLSPVRPDCPP